MKTILLNPFEVYSEKKLLIVGIIVTIIGSLSAYYFNIRYDGAIDLHFVDNTSLYQSFIDNIINIISLCIPLFIVGKIINNKTRIIDIITVILISKIPFYIISLSNINNIFYNTSKKLIGINTAEQIAQIKNLEWFIITISVILTLIGLIWFFALLFNGYKTATNAKGGKSIFLFVVAIIIAEILSKIIIFKFS